MTETTSDPCSTRPDALAIEGGTPVRAELLPYGRQWVDEEDIEAVVQVLRSDRLTTGPAVQEFEQALASRVGTQHAVAVNSGTAALHAAMHAIGIGPDDEVIVPAITFVATANAVLFEGGRPVFADVDPETLLIDPASVASRITPRTRAIIAVDYAGQPCDYRALRELADRHGLVLIADACHALGAEYTGKPVGSLADLSTFSFHPVKPITTGEGGMVTTNNDFYAQRLRRFRNHCMTRDAAERESAASWEYEICELGYNYRMPDIVAALGTRQLDKLDTFIARRRAIAARYHAFLSEMPAVAPLELLPERTHAYHLYVVRLQSEDPERARRHVFDALRAEGIGVNVHYIPVHLQPLYRRRFGTTKGLCPVAEDAYTRILSLPIFPAMAVEDVEDVIRAMSRVVNGYLH